MSRAQGFSLVELLLVMCIVGVLSIIAVPAYKTYVVKARVMELLSVADTYKIKLIDSLFAEDPQSKYVYNLNTKLVDYVAINTIANQPAKHVIHVVAKMKGPNSAGIGLLQPAEAEDALAIQLHGVEVGDMIEWSCHVASEYNEYVPKSCQNNDLEAISVG